MTSFEVFALILLGIIALMIFSGLNYLVQIRETLIAIRNRIPIPPRD